MKIKHLMTRPLRHTTPDATLQEAARTMRDEDVGVLAVMQGEKPVGVLTDRDLAIRAVAEGWEANSRPVREAMSERCVTCTVDEDSEAAARLMKKEGVRRLFVLDDDRVVGALSLGDLATGLETNDTVSKTLEALSA